MGSRVVLDPVDVQEVRAILLLREHSGLGDAGIRRLLDSFGSAARALRVVGSQGNLLDSDSKEGALSSWSKQGYAVFPMTSPRYPSSLLELADPPPLLFLMGRRELLFGPAVAIVGSRRATEVGRRAAETMGRILAQAGVTVVSGMALGIDSAAHWGALKGGGSTVAVLGSGLGILYPKSNRSLFREIRHRGLLVSEFLPQEPALPHHFPKRNRIIAALAKAVIVVEAGKRSGALITVDHGLDLGREIFVMPGSVENPQAAGSNALLREGARILPNPSNILEELDDLGFGISPGGEQASLGHDDGASIPLELRPLWTVLSGKPQAVDEVATGADVSVTRALAGLSALELGGWARRCPGMRFQRTGVDQ